MCAVTMTASPIASEVFGPLFSDAESARLFSDAESVRALIEVERALARAEARTGIVPKEAASAIDRALSGFAPDLRALGAGVESSGTPVVALVEQMRQAVGPEAAGYVHWGATSQDIIDTGLVLRLRLFLELAIGRVDRLIGQLANLADAHRGTVMVARTRMQPALPTTFGLVSAGWLLPLVRHRDRLADVRPRLLVVQFGGAAGTLAALGNKGLEVVRALAEELDLGVPPAPWHAQRDAIVECAGWLSMLSGSLGKLAQDIALLSQAEVGELRDARGGGSSTMPQKANPVRAETIIALARSNAASLSAMHQAAIQEHARGGAGWSLEWQSLPQMAVATGAALKHAQSMLGDLEIDVDRMAANLSLDNGSIMAEAIVFALAEHMPRAQASDLVKSAAVTARSQSRSLIEVVRERADITLDWESLGDPTSYLGVADQLIDQALAAARGESA